MAWRELLEALLRFFRRPEAALPTAKDRITAERLAETFGGKPVVYDRLVPHLNDVAEFYDINTPQRLAAFIAQLGHESARMTRLTENLNYSAKGLAKTWPNRYANADGTPNSIAHAIARNPEAIANHSYANRMGNGDVRSGDGWRYRGRGLIQVTGRDNYGVMTRALHHDFIRSPGDMALPQWAVWSAGVYWDQHGLNAFADRGDLIGMTRIINGGLNGLQDRSALYAKALEVFG